MNKAFGYCIRVILGLILFSMILNGQSITMPSSLSADTTSYVLLSSSGTTPSVSGFSTDLRVVLAVTNGTIRITTTAGLTAPTGYTTGQWNGNSEMAFEGSQTNVNNALATLAYQGGSVGATTLSASATPTGAAYNQDNGHYYRFVSTIGTWTTANAGASASTFNGLTGYLVTITSSTESDFVTGKVPDNTSSWVGGSDNAVEGEWRWVTGPENGTQFWSGDSTGSAVNGAYTNWNTAGEPNNGGPENYMERQITGEWNDVPDNGHGVLKPYVVEYGGLSGETSTVEDNTDLTIVSTQNPPSLTGSNPSDDATGVEPDANIVLTFSEAVDAESGNIEIRLSSNDNLVESILVTSGQVTGSGSTDITINPTSDFSLSTGYYVQIDATAFDDASSASYAGISNKTDLNFTTRGPVVATLSTTVISSISYTSASSGGNITDNGGASVTVRGVCWNTSTAPTTSNSTTSDGSGTGSFTSSLTGLTPATTYYIRAYATNSVGTGYGNERSFTTTAVSQPTVTTTSVSAITSTSASSGGNVTNEGGAPVTARGVCWNTSTNPTTANSTTSDGTGPGSFTSSLTGLTPGTIYYVRAYAVNSIGTSYGSEVSFTASAVNPTLTTTAVSGVTSTNASSGGNISDDGGAAITSRGVCWNTSTSPTTANSKTSKGTGIGTYSSSLTGLFPNTTYYVRAYAVNSAGTSYGNEVSFSTSGASPIVITKSASNVSLSGATLNATVIANNDSTSVSFEYGTTINYGSIIAASPGTATGSGDTIVNYVLTGLLPETLYHFRVVGVNNSGTSNGADMTFTTSNSLSKIYISRSYLNFGTDESVKTKKQNIIIENSGGKVLNWSLTYDASWLSCTPASGSGISEIIVSVDSSGLAVGTYTDNIIIIDPDAENSPKTVKVTLRVIKSGTTEAPFGYFETPVDGSNARNSIPVTGWVLDDVEVVSVHIYRNPMPNEGLSKIYIGDAVFVEGARPDIETLYHDYPLNYRAGWGYMLLTNFLPGNGNGSFTLNAVATDKDGNITDLGNRLISCDNVNVVKPFGAIDTPTQGGIAAGPGFINWGWALTPQPNKIPVDGSSIKVYIDSVQVGNPAYNNYRADIAALFPGYMNTDGAVGYFTIDTTGLSNGVHQIEWSATDNAGNIDGIGSRYFTVLNANQNRKGLSGTNRIDIKDLPDYNIINNPIELIRGFSSSYLTNSFADLHFVPVHNSRIIIKELERIIIKLNSDNENTNYSGYLKINNQLRTLPLGSSLKNGQFYWSPGPGFIGEYDLLFIDNINKTRNDIKVMIKPMYETKTNK